MTPARFEIRLNQFCALATSRAWHEWLRRYDEKLYTDFYDKLNHANGCNENKQIMHTVLDSLEAQPGGISALHVFLADKFPAMLVEVARKPKPSGNVPFTTDTTLTFPRRKIIFGSDAKKQAEVFVKGKLKSNFVVIDNVAYIEYLNDCDNNIADKLPNDKWRTYNYSKI